MATSWDSVHVQCPFYRENDARNVRCEGIWWGSGMTTTFHSSGKRQKHMQGLCMGLYTKCCLYRAIEKKYEEEIQ